MGSNRAADWSTAPEAVNPQTRATFGFVSSDDYEYYERPSDLAHERQISPEPEVYQHEAQSPRISDASPRMSAASPPPGSEIGRSPQMSDNGFAKSRPLSSTIEYSEIHSPDPQAVFTDDQTEKEAVQPRYSVAPAYTYAAPTPGIHHTNSGEKPQVWSGAHPTQHPYGQTSHEEERRGKKPIYKRWWFFAAILLVIIIAVAVPVGVVFGSKKDKNEPAADNGGNAGNGTTPDTGNPNTSVGGNLNAAYYSQAGAFNGSGIAIAAANTELNQAIYAFYQDYQGRLSGTLYDVQGQWNSIGYIDGGSHQALNGTPISAVQHLIGDVIKWHVFFIDKDYILRERILTNSTVNGPVAVWQDGPLSSQNIATWKNDTIGMQACYYGNYYGQWSYDATAITPGIHLFYASDANTFKQYDWSNGTDAYSYVQDWDNLSGNGGVGCYTWGSMTEYVWFVEPSGSLQMSWRDTNRSAPATASHPINKWTQVNNLGIDNVQIDSSLGYTNYMVWQDQSTAIKGAGITWEAENTKVKTTDLFTLTDSQKNPIPVVRGTHLSVTAVQTVSGGSQLQLFFQEVGNGITQYIRDAYTPGALFSEAPSVPVAPPESSP